MSAVAMGVGLVRMGMGVSRCVVVFVSISPHRRAMQEARRQAALQREEEKRKAELLEETERLARQRAEQEEEERRKEEEERERKAKMIADAREKARLARQQEA